MNIIITGSPRSGKTTLLQKVIARGERRKGFLTAEVREDGERTGFELQTSEGATMMLASIHIDSAIRVSRYGVNVDAVESLLPKLMDFDDELLYIDEIGQMELHAAGFPDLVRKYLDAPNHCIATLSQVCDHPFIHEVRSRDDVRIFELTPEDREDVYQHILKLSGIFQP